MQVKTVLPEELIEFLMNFCRRIIQIIFCIPVIQLHSEHTSGNNCLCAAQGII